MRAVLLVGYGSVLPGIGTTMIRLASRITSAGIAPIAASAFIFGCRPSIHEAIGNCVASGADDIIIQPYTLVEDGPIRTDLQRIVRLSRATYPQVQIRVARPFGDHAAVANVAIQRAIEADYAASHNMHSLPLLNAHEQIVARPPATLYTAASTSSYREIVQDQWRPRHMDQPTGLILVAHGSNKATWDWPINVAAEWIRINTRYAAVGVGFAKHHQPDLTSAIDQQAARGIQSLILVPFMLQLTASDTEYLLVTAEAARQQYPDIQILVADHLNYDRQFLRVIGDRVADVVSGRFQRRRSAI